ncbi:MAG: hypothetical protein HOW97_17145 [Catenulispora sp.]|nr:hypothetical protein [Catenulispora sp.]
MFWTRARHPDLGETVFPAAAVESYPGWEPVGEPTEDADALRAAMAAEQLAAAEPPPAPAPAPATVSAPPASKASTPDPQSTAPSGADQKEQ